MGEFLGQERTDKGSDSPAAMDCSGAEGSVLVGSYVCKNSSESRRLLVGKVASFDEASRLFVVVYEDGHREELNELQVRQVIMVDDYAHPGSSIRLTCKKRKLDSLVVSFTGDLKMPAPSRPGKNISDVSNGVQSSSHCAMDSDLSEDADSSSNSCDYQRDSNFSTLPELQVLKLLPSSGDIAVPDGSITYLFSVYNFLRSFSVQLFLSPFTLDDFVGSLNYMSQNSLFDAIHISLMRALMRHLQMLSSEGSELASKCLRYHDWSLLDALTWPVFLVEYIYIMGYMKRFGDDFRGILSNGDYYGLPVETKLKILQILCDDAIDSAELRTELESRESIEGEMEDTQSASIPQESQSTMVQIKSFNTYANGSSDALLDKSELNKPTAKLENKELDIEASKDATDENSDECRLCGMDGTLICCDGCPSAYHSRCIGLNKQFLPDGLWFCPECVIDKVGPTCSRIGRGTKGAEVFGVDVHGRMFLGTCNYLLVIETSLNGEPLSRYYNQRDVFNILSLITSVGENALVYSYICERISKYWELPTVIWPSSSSKPIGNNSADKKNAKNIIPSPVNAANDNSEMQNYESTVDIEHRHQNTVLGLVDQTSFPDGRSSGMTDCGVAAMKIQTDVDETASSSRKGERLETQRNGSATPVNQTRSNNQFGNEFALAAMSCSNVAHSAERSTILGISSSASTSENASRGNAGSSCFSPNYYSLALSDGSRIGGQHSSGLCREISGRTFSILASFKPQAYINQYVHGDIAASAAANLAVLASEESKISEVHASTNPRKTVASITALQMKAFSGAVMHFQWPSFERKLVDIPRERCGWCIACKGAVAGKKGCFLNVAATNAIKRCARNIVVVRSIKPNETQYIVIASHIANMEEILHGLLVGSFLVAEYVSQWRKRLREAFSCNAIKDLLLELEKNIRGVAFSAGWFKLLNDEFIDSSASLLGPSRAGTTYQKRGRRSKKNSLGESAVLFSDDSWKDVQWWRGTKLSRIVFQKGILPSSQVKKAARQCGFKRILGVCYSESSHLPKRTRQIAWRAAVQMSKNASQLALQVRYIDAHIRWKDLFYSDSVAVEGKASEVDTVAFRNAVICDKRLDGDKVIYGLTFPNQKHLPLRVSKNIVEKDNNDQNSKLWFSEQHIPLHMVKEFEEKVGKKTMPPPAKLTSLTLTKFRRNQLKTRWRDIFSYLAFRRDQPKASSCASCRREVFLRDAATCGICQVNCHKDCLIPLIAVKVAGLPYIPACKACYHVKTKASRQETPNSLLPLQRQGFAVSGTKSSLQTNVLPSLGPFAHHKAELPPKKSSTPSTSTITSKNGHGKPQSYGLIWKRKKGDDCGQNFRQTNIILKGKGDSFSLKEPTCCLCNTPYSSDLVYICCEKCQNWYHADALQFEESQLFDLVGFKCNKCRRKASPQCPYHKKVGREPNNYDVLKGKIGGSTMPPSFSQSAEHDLISVNDDPLLHSLGIVEPIPQKAAETQVGLNGSNTVSWSHQKFSARRAQEKTNSECSHLADDANPPASTTYIESHSMGTNHADSIDRYNILSTDSEQIVGPCDMESSPLLELVFPENVDYGNLSDQNANNDNQYLDTGDGCSKDMEYEPQTYFSLTELMASDDGQLDDSYVDPTNLNDGFTNTYEEKPAYNEFLGEQVGHVSENSTMTRTAPLEPQCSLCKLNQPSPDLSCEICGQHVHSHCSPWVEDAEPSIGTNWRCGNCRDWR